MRDAGAAVQEPEVGPKPTSRQVRYSVVIGVKADTDNSRQCRRASLKIQVYGANSNCDVNAICKSELRSSCESDGGFKTDYAMAAAPLSAEVLQSSLNERVDMRLANLFR